VSLKSEALLARLPKACLDRLNASQVKKLRLKEQIRLLKKEQVNQIDVSCIEHLTDLQICLLREETLIQALSLDKLKYVIRHSNEFVRALNPEVIRKFPFSTLWSQPTDVLKKASAIKKFVLFTGFFIQSIVLSLMSALLTITVSIVTLGLFAFIPPVRAFIKKSWRLTTYSWRCFKIF
jgi:hypothetical protein